MRAGVLIGLAVVLGVGAFACASIVGLDGSDPENPGTPSGDDDDSTSGTSGVSGTSGTGNNASTSSGASGTSGSTASGGVDAGPDVIEPAPNGGPCEGPENKCKGTQACAEDFLCRDTCEGVGQGCTFDKGQCCVTFFCPFGVPEVTSTCQKCIADGQMADRVVGAPSSRSCCSGKADFISGKCKK